MLQDSGILNINKPAGWTSARVVSYVKKKLRLKKAGHCGTLDPRASGVLLVCCGSATKLSAQYMDLPKTYHGIFFFGMTTDSGDLDGAIDSIHKPSMIVEHSIRENFHHFIGTVTQLPPMYSAVKVKGEPLYLKARRGESAIRLPRQVTIYSLELLSIKGFEVEFRCTCSKGTYIRTLIEDIGKRVGCGAVLVSLVRESVGQYVLSDALSLDNVSCINSDQG